MQIDIAVAGSISASADRAREVLRDVENYPRWWPRRTAQVPGADDAFIVQPLPMPWPRIVLRRLASPRGTVGFSYEGPLRGTGIWTVESRGDRTTVTYRVVLTPANPLLALVAATPMFRWKHRRDILGIIRALDIEAAR